MERIGNQDYELIDSGDGKKYERFHHLFLVRPSPQAVWRPNISWNRIDMTFSREEGEGWKIKGKPPASWIVEISSLRFRALLTDFGHIGIFPEHRFVWDFLASKVQKGDTLLNLFAYTGGATFAAAQAGAEVVHLDSSKKAIEWAKENAVQNGLEKAPIRYILEDVSKFLKREVKRGKRYQGIVLDPPTFGRGAKNEVFKIEKDITAILDLCFELLEPKTGYLVFTCHTPGFSPLVLTNLLAYYAPKDTISAGELTLPATSGWTLPTGSFAIYQGNSSDRVHV